MSDYKRRLERAHDSAVTAAHHLSEAARYAEPSDLPLIEMAANDARLLYGQIYRLIAAVEDSG